MTRMFTGFWEATADGVPEGEGDVATSIKYLTTDQLLERLRARLNDVTPGTHIVVDIVAWGEPE